MYAYTYVYTHTHNFIMNAILCIHTKWVWQKWFGQSLYSLFCWS